MVREIAVTVYLLVFRFIFTIFKLFPEKSKTVGVASFGDNIFYTVRSLKQLSDHPVIILAHPSCNYDFNETADQVIPFSIRRPVSYLLSIYHLATARTVLIDNYEAFLSETTFREGTRCIQLWHAAGAIKKYGLENPANKYRGSKSIERFKRVYARFDYAVVGSDKMAESFYSSFGLTEQRIIRTGVPRTDILFDIQERSNLYSEIMERFPAIGDRKIMLYAPTYRESELGIHSLELDIQKMYQELSDEYVLFIKLHPAVSGSLDFSNYPDFVFDMSDFRETNRLLLAADLLITDYSSIPFEYALLNRPMVFFAYDLEEYKIKSGLIEAYEDQMPGPIVFDTSQLIDRIKSGSFDYEQIKEYSVVWNLYSDGNSSMKLARFLVGAEEKATEKAVI